VLWDFWVIAKSMFNADHIHLRVPGNVGMISSIAQILFPWKKKTAKYAGNWDWKSKQPFSYRLQQRILQNTWLTHNMQVLVYGKWPNSTKNILPFFTASYTEKEIDPSPPRSLQGKLKLMFVGALFEGKKPMLTIEALQALLGKGIMAELHMFGNGPDYEKLEGYITAHQLQQNVHCTAINRLT